MYNMYKSVEKCTLECNSVVIRDRERDVQVCKNVKVNFK